MTSVEFKIKEESLQNVECEAAELRESVQILEAAAAASSRMFADATVLLQERDQTITSLKVGHNHHVFES